MRMTRISPRRFFSTRYSPYAIRHLPYAIGYSRCSLNLHNDWRAFPQFFQAIVIAHRRAKEMHQHSVVIHQDPAGLGRPLDSEREDGFFLQLLLNFVRYRFHLPFVVRRRNDEIIGDERDWARIEQQNIRALFFGNQIQNDAREFVRFQKCTSLFRISLKS